MKYKNAKDILPRELLEILREYASGELLYIPKADEDKSEWGTISGTRSLLQKRNAEICRAYESGICISEIADTFCLSPDSIRKIVYGTAFERKEKAAV